MKKIWISLKDIGPGWVVYGLLLVGLVVILFLLSGCTPSTPSLDTVAQTDPQLAATYFQATQDVALSLANAQMTIQAGTQIAYIQQSQAKATADAPFVAMTNAAAELQIQAMQSAATMTQAAFDSTTTAAQWTPTVTSTPTPNVTQTLIFAQSVADIKNIRLETERAETVNTMKAVAGYAILFICALLGVVYAYVHLKRLSFSHPGVDDFGKPLPLLNYIEGVVTDLDKATNGTVAITQKFLKELPSITGERQDRVTLSSHVIDMNTRRAVPKRLTQTQVAGLLPESVEQPQAGYENNAANLPLPPWEFMRDWKGDNRPLGFGLKGLITAQAASPHLLVSGKTHSGKTLYMLRTQATASLARGYQVINLGFSDAGFGVFNGHPNYHSIQLNQASDIIPCLASVYDNELRERKQILGGESYDWEHWPTGTPPRPFIDLLIDELGNLAEDIYTSEETRKEGALKTQELWRHISKIANEGAKFGIRFIAALQDPTAKSVDLRFRRNCTLVSFQQGDANQSSTFLGATGAELLPVGHFMTRTDALVIGGGFCPSDEEIKTYLQQHAAPQTPAPNWIDGVLIPQAALPMRESVRLSAPSKPKKNSSTVAEFVIKLLPWEAEALSLYMDGLEIDHIVESVWKDDDPRIGQVAVTELIERWKAVKNLGNAPAQDSSVVAVADVESQLESIEKQKQADEARKRAEDDAKIRLLHARGEMNNTEIAYAVLGRSSKDIKKNIERVKEVLSTSTSTSTSLPLQEENRPEMPMNGALPA